MVTKMTPLEIEQRKEKGYESPVITPEKSPTWAFGLSLTFVVVVLPLLIMAAFYYGWINV